MGFGKKLQNNLIVMPGRPKVNLGDGGKDLGIQVMCDHQTKKAVVQFSHACQFVALNAKQARDIGAFLIKAAVTLDAIEKGIIKPGEELTPDALDKALPDAEKTPAGELEESKANSSTTDQSTTTADAPPSPSDPTLSTSPQAAEPTEDA